MTNRNGGLAASVLRQKRPESLGRNRNSFLSYPHIFLPASVGLIAFAILIACCAVLTASPLGRLAASVALIDQRSAKIADQLSIIAKETQLAMPGDVHAPPRGQTFRQLAKGRLVLTPIPPACSHLRLFSIAVTVALVALHH